MAATGVVRYNIPDFSVPAEERCTFAFAAPKDVADLSVPLRDARTDPDIVKGPAGIDVQGFTLIKHRSALHNSDRWFTGQDFEEVYMPEVCDLVCKVTGAKKAIINNCAFRRRLADEQADPKFYLKRGHMFDQELAKFPKNVALGEFSFIEDLKITLI